MFLKPTFLKSKNSSWVVLAFFAAQFVFYAQADAEAGQAEQSASIQAAREFVVNNPGWSLHGKDQSYDVRDVIIDNNGSRHVRFDRRYKNLEVLGGDFVVHSTGSGNFINTTLTLKRQLDLSIKPTLTATQASSLALKSKGGETLNSLPRLVIYARKDIPALAWDVLVFSTKPDGTPSEQHVIVDAHRGTILESWDSIHTSAVSNSTGKGYMVGQVSLTTDLVNSVYYLRDPNRGGHYTSNMSSKTNGGAIFTDLDNGWGDSSLSTAQTVGVDAHFGFAVTWDFYKTVDSTRSLVSSSGNGAYSRVHYGRKLNNAFWSDSCFCMSYGDGDGTTYNPFVSLDVAGHEMTHGITSRTANLTYSGESGGLNEATSDIFGTMVEFSANNAKDPGDYLIGEMLFKSQNTISTKALRYMSQPSKDGASPDCYYSGIGNLDVHYSSGIANRFFYILSEGMSGSSTCNAKSVSGIGRSSAAKIWYRALTVYMNSSTNYAGARTATLKAASDLYGASSTAYSTVAAAWSSVLVN